MKTRKSAFIKSVIALLICFAMLIGTTFAWFTDSVTSSKNIITAGNLDLEMYWTDDPASGVWYNVEDAQYNTIFSYDNWEPGYTDVKYIKLVNKGSLALNYELSITPETAVGKLAEVINVFYAEGEVALQNRSDLSNLRAIGLLNNVLNGASTAKGTLLPAGKTDLIHPAGEVVMTFAMNMITSAGNEYMNESSGEFSITALATQAVYESDFFGNDYDTDAEMPTILKGKKITVSVTPDNGKVPAGGVTMQDGAVSAFIPEGVKLEDGADKLTLTITPLEKTTSGIVAFENEMLMPVDIHIDGVAEDNTVPMTINLGAVMPKYLNIGNYNYIHVEDGVNQVMTLVDSEAELNAHNQFYYDPATGNTGVSMASFSEVAMHADLERKWNGGEDYDWYTDEAIADKSFDIVNADQLYAFSKLVGGMSSKNDYVAVDFDGDTVNLIFDINLNYGAGNDGTTTKIFYPIGYYNNTTDKIYDRTEATVEGIEGVESSVSAFKGTFNGNGHVISNIYQNTWDMFGDYNDGYPENSNYYKDAMGLFGYVTGGTVKNLTVKNFSSDGEFTPTGVIAAYADNATFENISIFNCNPRVYNTGNGGIVGIAGDSDDTEESSVIFNYITVDNSNKITALWGSWDVACGGLVGMFRDEGHVYMNNCHVGAQIDVYNDVCGNYQYYWYRYSGMLIGTNRNMTTDDKGYTVPETDKFHATDCTVHFGDWNNYYYCELVANSLASYTHDHQFSRLTQIQDISEIQDEQGNWKTTGNFILMDGKTPTETCIHIMKNADGELYEHKHDEADATNPEVNEVVNGESVLKENNQRVYLQFKQLFTGYGWGVKHVPIYNDGTENPFTGVTIIDRTEADSVVKFSSKVDANGGFKFYVKDTEDYTGTITVGELFAAINDASVDDAIKVNATSHVSVTITRNDENGYVSGLYEPNAEDWTLGTIKFTNTGYVTITIQDHFYCEPTVITIEVVGNVTIEPGDGWGDL